jgi:hypothetical protein
MEAAGNKPVLLFAWDQVFVTLPMEKK